MTIPIENSSGQLARDLVQHRYNKTIELENKLRSSIQSKTPSDPNIWAQMRENYEAIILEDHDFSESHEIEHALWHLHYKRIEDFRARMRNAAAAASGNIPSQGGKSVLRREQVNKIRSVFKSFLSEATGFYHDVMLKIRAKYGFPLDYFSHQGGDFFGSTKDESKSSNLRKGQVSCHRCLIYLGDLARYKELYGEGESSGRDFSVAASYYVQAASLWPSSGNPHHQLAILATYMGDELVAVYRYFRSLAIDSPFSTARDNLILIFEKNRQHYSQLLLDPEVTLSKPTATKGSGRGGGRGDVRFSMKDPKQGVTIVKRKQVNVAEVNRTFRIRFVRLNGILFTRTSLETFGEVYSSAINEFEELLKPGLNSEMGIGSDACVNNGSSYSGLVVLQLVSILIFTVHNVNRDAESRSLSYAEILQRSVLLQNAFTAAFEFAGHIINKCVNAEDVSSSPLLPAVLVFMEWLACRPDVAMGNDVEERQACARSYFWSHCVACLNKLLDLEKAYQGSLEGEITFTSLSKYHEDEAGGGVALWEDFELRGFVPLAPAQLGLDFSKRHSYIGLGGKKEKMIRVQRILAAGKAITNLVEGSGQGIYFDEYLTKFGIAGEMLERKSEDKFEAVKCKISNTVEKNDNSLQETRSHSAKQQDASVEKLVSCASGVPTVKTESDKEEEEDEVIVFRPNVVERYPELPVSNSHQTPISGATGTIHNLVAAFAPQEPRQCVSNLPTLHELTSQITGYSSSFAAAVNPSSGTYSPAQEVPTVLGSSSTSTVDHWSTGIGISAAEPTGNGGTFTTNHERVASLTDVIQQPSRHLNQINPVWYRDHEALVLNGMMNLNLGHHFTENGSMFRSELLGAKEVSSTHSNLVHLPHFSHELSSTAPLDNGVTVGKPNANIPEKSVSSDLSLAKVQAHTGLPESSVEHHVTSLPSHSDSDAVSSTSASTITTKPGIPTIKSKKGPMNRPVRHFGPPPGFGPVPTRLPDNSKVDSLQQTCEQTVQRDEQTQMDDYSWLDGYTSARNGRQINDLPVSLSGYSFLPTSDSLISDAANFPFPGKQVPNIQYKTQQHHPLQQEMLVLPKQEQKQSLWSQQFFGHDPYVP